jgi:hypothetical protein
MTLSSPMASAGIVPRILACSYPGLLAEVVAGLTGVLHGVLEELCLLRRGLQFELSDEFHSWSNSAKSFGDGSETG